jgi:hypothetical protein
MGSDAILFSQACVEFAEMESDPIFSAAVCAAEPVRGATHFAAR